MRGMEVGLEKESAGFASLAAAASRLAASDDLRLADRTPVSAGVVFDRNMITGDVVWGPSFQELTGYAGEPPVNTAGWWTQQIHPQDVAPAQATLDRSARDGQPSYCLHYRFRHQTGRWLFLRENGVFERNPGNALQRITGFVCDLSPLHEAQTALSQAHRLLERITEATPDLLYLYDLNEERNLYANREMGRVLGYASAEITAMGPAFLPRVLHPEDLETFDAFRARLDELAEGEVFEHEYRVRDAAGTYRWLRAREVVFARSKDGRPSHIVGLAQDISRHKAREARLTASEAALREADHRKDEFLAMLSHELRNPLAPISNALHIMAAHAPSENVRQRKVIERQVRYVERLIQDLLDVSRVTQGKIELRKEFVELSEVLKSSIEATLPLFRQKKQRVQVEVAAHGFPLRADVVRLSQVFTNVLSNASKYTGSLGRITVKARVEGAEAVVSIRDTGQGMPPELVPRVFDLFVQGPRSIARSEGGLGLGLPIARRLLEMHGGTIAATSEGEGKGSEFVMRLPLCPPPKRTRRHRSEAQQELGLDRELPRRILVVDDNEDAAETLAEVLRMSGHHVDVAYDGADVLPRVRAFEPEIVFMDIGLPTLDGYQAARQVREDPKVPRQLRLIAVTGYGHEEDRRKAFEAGFDEHMVKPVDLDRLHRLLRN